MMYHYGVTAQFEILGKYTMEILSVFVSSSIKTCNKNTSDNDIFYIIMTKPLLAAKKILKVNSMKSSGSRRFLFMLYMYVHGPVLHMVYGVRGRPI